VFLLDVSWVCLLVFRSTKDICLFCFCSVMVVFRECLNFLRSDVVWCFLSLCWLVRDF